MNCPVCTQAMVDITIPRLTSGFVWERWRCNPCKIVARVEITYSADESADYTNRGEVMNPPVPAALGTEARNLNTPHRDGTGAVPQGLEAQATQPAAAPSIGDPCPVCTGRLGQSGYNYRCANCGWLGPRVAWAPEFALTSTSNEATK